MYKLFHIAVVALTAALVTSTRLTDLEILAIDAPQEIKETYPYYLSGYDEDGAPIWIFELGFSLRQVRHPKTVQFLLRRFLRLEEIVRDGSLKHIWIVNVNALFDWLWKLGSPLLGSLANSIELYGTNKKLWLPKLLSQLPRDQLPEWYGGTPGQKPLKILG
ncbi:unnamed protein product [Allacma fusca]|uniref:CRAL-TRIO domain-containing protein n=1 Tax=Allacma fusca TaxID=39272 RepID=A0A8J2J6K2_9HEXA|nr:unnamed protein product [Allacma fusca]